MKLPLKWPKGCTFKSVLCPLKVKVCALWGYNDCGMGTMRNLYVLGHYLLELCQLVQWEEQRYGLSYKL